jgi:putative endonuclease
VIKTLYIGITTDIQRRIKEHNYTLKGAKYTRIRRPVTLVYYEKVLGKSEAAKREYLLKKLSRVQKIQKIYSDTNLLFFR